MELEMELSRCASPADHGHLGSGSRATVCGRGSGRCATGHADTQNALAHVLREAGIEPRSRRPQEPNFDLAWEANGAVFVGEVKSITDANEEGQLRLGLGQVLRNRQRLRALGHQHVVAVFVPERAPRDPAWRDLCDELDVVLLSGDELDRAPTLGTTAAATRPADAR
jgi:hypothetical protein